VFTRPALPCGLVQSNTSPLAGEVGPPRSGRPDGGANFVLDSRPPETYYRV